MTTTYQPFGQPTNSDYGKSRGAGKTHWGQDFTAANGTQIPSATAGTVIFSGYNPSGGLGWCVVVKDVNGVGHVYAHMGVARDNGNPNSPPDGMPAVGESIRVGESLGPVGNTGQVIPPPTDRQPYLGTHLHIATVDADATRAIETQGKAIGTGGSGSLGVRLDGSTTLNPDEYIQNNADLFNPAPVTLSNTPDSASTPSHSEITSPTDPMGSDDGKSIMDAASGGATARADENYSHEGRNSPTSPTTPTSKPASGPAGDSIDANLPDDTRVISTSTTVNDQTTVTTQLLDKEGHVLLSAGAGQTMERDPETGIVQVRTGTSDQVQQYDPSTGEVSHALRTGSDAAHVYESLIDAFSNPQVPTDNGVQIADASGALPDPTAHTNHNTFNNYLDSQGNTLTTKQQDALATQIDKLNLGGDKELSFYSLPSGGALIANADGDIVGEIVHSNSGDLNLKATAIDTSGNTVEVNTHISEQGQTLSENQWNAQTQQQATNMFNSLIAVNNWDHLNDVGKLSALVNLYNATDKLGEAFGATGDNLPGDLGAAAGYLQLVQGLQSGDKLIIANGINVVSDGALDNAMNNALGSTAEGEAVPYLSYALAIRNFADNPEQAMLTGAGTYAGEALGAALGGPIGAAIGGAIGGIIGGALGGALGFGDDDPPPPPEGAAHFSWDANGHIQHTVDYNQSGGGDAANSVAASVQGLLEQVVQAINDKTPSTADDVALNPYLIPRVGFSSGGAWIEVSLPDGSTVREGLNGETIATRLIGLLQDNGGSGKENQYSILASRYIGLMPSPTAILKIEHRQVNCCINSKMNKKILSTPAGNPKFSLDKPCSLNSSRTVSPKVCANFRAYDFAVNRWTLF